MTQHSIIRSNFVALMISPPCVACVVWQMVVEKSRLASVRSIRILFDPADIVFGEVSFNQTGPPTPILQLARSKLFSTDSSHLLNPNLIPCIEILALVDHGMMDMDMG